MSFLPYYVPLFSGEGYVSLPELVLLIVLVVLMGRAIVSVDTSERRTEK